MKRFNLNQFPAIKACLLTLLIALPFCVYLYSSTKQQLEENLSEQLQEISSFAKKQLALVNVENEDNLMMTISDHLTTFSAVDTIAVMTKQYKIIFNGGSQNFRSVNPRHLGQEEQLVRSNKHKIFVAPIKNHNDKLSGWLLMELNPTFLERKQHRLINILIMVCAALILFFIVALWLYRKQFVKSVKNVSSHAAKALPFKPTPTGFKELDLLSHQIAGLADQLSQLEISMTEEIKQTTEDLRETLETIEIQNVELDIARKDAVLANRTKSEFLANMSHEVRTPLNGIIGFTNLLLKSNLSNQQRDHLLTIKKSSEILLMIINDILDFSKIEAGKLLLDNQPLDLREVIDEVIIMLAPTAHTKHLELVHLHYQDVPKMLVGDPLRIKQVVTNLINNAIKFTQVGEVVVRAMIDENDRVRITVSDTGVGLSRAQQHSIFKAFSQADASTARNFGGTGLGLTISQKLIEQMNGKIGFESELGHGSTFWFTLPVTEPAAPNEAVIKSSKEDLKHLEINVYEANEPARFAVEHLLNEWQLNFNTFSDLQALIQRSQKKTVTFAIGRLFDDWKTNRTHSNSSNENNDTEAGKDRTLITVLSIDSKEVYQSEKIELIKQLQQVNQKVLLVTPTLDSYDAPTIQAANGHLVKPITHDRLLHSLSELAGDEEQNLDDVTPQEKVNLQYLENQAVLVVDDNEINLNLMTALLDHFNISAYAASDGYEAVELCKQEIFPLIFMDIQMPGMDGIQTMKRIRELDPAYEQSAIIALTAYALPQERENFLNQGFQHLLTKPVDEAQLSSILTSYLCNAPKIEAPESIVATPESHTQDTSLQIDKEIVDLKESIHLSNGNPALAIDLMSKFLSSLADQKEQIERFNKNKEPKELERVIHKLHGACHYCGVPKLRAASLAAEHALKLKQEDAESKTLTLLSEIEKLLAWNRDNQAEDWQKTLLSFENA